jgi:hypothetical protein
MACVPRIVDDVELGGRNGEARAGRGNSEVAIHRQPAAAAEAAPFDRRNHRARQGEDRFRRCVDGLGIGIAGRGIASRRVKLADIGACAEMAARAGEDHRTDLIRCAQRPHRSG